MSLIVRPTSSDAQAGGIQHLQHRFIAQLQRLLHQRLQQTFNLRL
jgi:hypothetical protein